MDSTEELTCKDHTELVPETTKVPLVEDTTIYKLPGEPQITTVAPSDSSTTFSESDTEVILTLMDYTYTSTIDKNILALTKNVSIERLRATRRFFLTAIFKFSEKYSCRLSIVH